MPPTLPHRADVAVVQLDAGTEATAGCRLSFFAVFDGHGGKNVAQHAAANLHACVLAAGLQAEAQRLAAAAAAGVSGSGEQQGAAAAPAAAVQPSIKRCKAAITDGFRELDRKVLEQCCSGPGQPGWSDGCTVVAAWVVGDVVLTANLGDARGVLARRPQPALAEAAKQTARAQAEGTQPAAGQPPAAGQQPAVQPLKAIVLTREHKAIFPQERQRIEKAGSFVSADGRLAGAPGASAAAHARWPPLPLTAGARSARHGRPPLMRVRMPCLAAAAGRIEVARAFGDRQFKKLGMSSVPDIQVTRGRTPPSQAHGNTGRPLPVFGAPPRAWRAPPSLPALPTSCGPPPACAAGLPNHAPRRLPAAGL